MADGKELTEEEKMAAEWAAMADDTPAAAAEGTGGGGDDMAAAMGGEARVLSQNEIDSLLGFDSGAGNNENSGIMAIINSALVNY